MSTELAERTPQQQLIAQVRHPQFSEQVRMALPTTVSVDRFVRATVTAVMQNPEIVKAETASIMQSLIRCAQDGLMPDGREAALVAFGGKAQYLAMIGGLRKIAAEHGWSIETRLVYANDEFTYELGLEPKLVHVPTRAGGARGAMLAAYAVGRHRDGRLLVEVMYAEDIAKVQKASRAGNSGPWRDWPERMWEKTVGRRLFTKLPLGERDSERVSRVIEASYEPGEAAATMYGQAAAEQAALPAATPQVAADGGGGAAAAEQQAAVGGESDGVAAAVAPAADPAPADDEPGPDDPEPGAQAAFQIPDQVIAEAAAYVVPSGNWEGKTLDEIAAEPKGEQWMAWVLANTGRVAAPTVQAVTAYASARLPHLVGGEG